MASPGRPPAYGSFVRAGGPASGGASLGVAWPRLNALSRPGFLSTYTKLETFGTVDLLLLILAPALASAVLYILFANVYHRAWMAVAGVIMALLVGDAVVGFHYRETPLHLYMAGFVLVAVCSSTAIGLMSFEVALSDYWFLYESNSYTNIIPSESAAGFADAGKVTFADGVRIDSEKAVGYKDRGVYCVAPIVDEAQTGMVEFWAVGRDCCAARGAFWCGDAWNPKAKSGVVIRDTNGQYAAAIRLAEAAMSLASPERPVLVDWVADPELVELNLRRVGIAVLLAAFLVQVLLFGLAAFGLNAVLKGYPNFFR